MVLEDMPLVLKAPEMAKVLRISRASAYAMCQEGRIEIIRVGRSIRIPRVAVERLLSGQGEEKAPKALED